MSDYTKSTNFASKDSLISGNPLKIVKGTELDTEFNNIATAVATKADLSSPALIGTPTAPTATTGTNTTQLATTAFVQAALQALYPVGSVYINASVTTNPATLLGFGTWVTVGDGKVLVNQDTTDSSFDVMGETGGSKDSAVVSHSHTVTDAGHTHLLVNGNNGPSGSSGNVNTTTNKYINYAKGIGGGATGENYSMWGDTTTPDRGVSGTSTTGISIDSAGTSGTNGNLQPYVVVKMWKRTA